MSSAAFKNICRRRFVPVTRCLDPVITMNLVFDIVILLLSVYSYVKKRSSILLWLTVAFSIFAASYALTILEVANSLILIPMRTIRYLSIIAGIGVHHIQQR